MLFFGLLGIAIPVVVFMYGADTTTGASSQPSPGQRADQHYLAGVSHYQAGRNDDALKELSAVLATPRADLADYHHYLPAAHYFVGMIHLRSSPPACRSAQRDIAALNTLDREFSLKLLDEYRLRRCEQQ